MIDIKLTPSKSERTWFGAMMFVVFAIIGTVVHFKFDRATIAYVAWGLSVLVPAVYYIVPPLQPAIYRGWMLLVFPVGWTVSHLVLVVIYYFAITPLGLVVRMLGYDPMKRRFDRRARTYWVEHRPGGNVWRYFRQY